MSLFSIHITQFGEAAILIGWPKEVNKNILNDILSFEEKLKLYTSEKNIECIVAYNSLTLIYNDKIDISEEKERLLQVYKQEHTSKENNSKCWKVPVCYDTAFGIDLEEVGKKLNLSSNEVIELHTRQSYTVYGIGFLPGFMYLGGLPNQLEIPRRATPRLDVKKGSVGLASKQTGIYPQDSPGGWNIIGNCPIPIFDAKQSSPCFVSVGDEIQFYEISKAKHDLLKIEVEVGIFNNANLLQNV